MERRVIVSIGIIIFLATSSFAIGVVYLNNQSIDLVDIHEFEWAVDVGDTFDFEIIVSGGSFDGWGDEGSPPPLSEFNETIIHAEVIYLPANTTSLDNATILSEIIMPIKFRCTFGNTSEIPEPVNSRLSELLSWSLVPIDSWDLLNACFYENRFLNPFSYEDQKICKVNLDDSSLNLTISVQKDWLHAIGESWSCAVNRTTGLPYWMAYSDYMFSCVGSGYRTVLTMNRTK